MVTILVTNNVHLEARHFLARVRPLSGRVHAPTSEETVHGGTTARTQHAKGLSVPSTHATNRAIQKSRCPGCPCAHATLPVRSARTDRGIGAVLGLT